MLQQSAHSSRATVNKEQTKLMDVSEFNFGNEGCRINKTGEKSH